MAQAKTHYNFYLSLTAVASVILGFWLAIVPQLKAAKDDKIELVQVKAKAQAAKDRLEIVRRLDELIKKNPQDYELLTLALPTDSDVGSALVALEALGTKTGLSVVSIDPGRGEASTGRLPVSVRVQGGYANLVDFMIASQKNLRPITISTATLTKVADSSSLEGLFSLQLLFSASPPPPSQPAAAEPAPPGVPGQ